ncbi:MAG: hypothetical protein ABI672_01610 [Vicinamibacteria bacterium]
MAADKTRDRLDKWKSQNWQTYTRVRKAYKAMLGRVKVSDAGERQVRIEYDEKLGVRLGGLNRAMAKYPALAVKDFPTKAKAIGVPLGPIVRRGASDPMAAMKRATLTRLIAAGLKGRKFADVRALLLFSVGLIRGFDLKMARKVIGIRSGVPIQKIVTHVTRTATIKTAVPLTQLERAERMLNVLQRPGK